MSTENEREKLREKYCREAKERWIESEQKRLNQMFLALGSTDINDCVWNFSQYEFETLDKVRNSIESGDRKAMLALLAITADSLQAFDVLPKDVRVALAYGLQKMNIKLKESPGFLPRGRGESSESGILKKYNKEYWTALSVEHYRYLKGCSLEDAIAKVSEEKGLTDSLVQKRWSKCHKDAKKTLEIVYSVSKRSKKKVVSKPRRKVN